MIVDEDIWVFLHIRIQKQAWASPPDVRMLRGSSDVKALNINRQVDVKLNEFAKQILLLLPLLPRHRAAAKVSAIELRHRGLI